MLGLVCFVTTLVEPEANSSYPRRTIASMSIIEILQQEIFTKKLFKISPEHITQNTDNMLQVTKQWNKGSKFNKVVSKRLVTSGPGSSVPLQARMCILTPSSRTRHWPSPNQTASLGWTWERIEREKYCWQVTTNKKKESFVGAESSKWAERSLEGAKQPSSARSWQRSSRPGDVEAAPPWCPQDSGLCPSAAEVSTWGPEMILQHCWEPVPSTFQLVQGKLNTIVLLMFIIAVPSLFKFLVFR